MNDKSILITNLEWLMKKKKLTTTSLSKATKVTQPTIFRILSGESNDPRTLTLAPIANYFNISVEQLRTHDLTGTKNISTERIKGYVPIISWLQAANFKEFVNSMNSQSSEWAESIINPHKNTYALRVKGDSMYPLFAENDIIIVEPDMKAENGDYVVVCRDATEEATFKKLIKDGRDWYLKPLNNNYRTILMTKDDIICGVIRAKQQIFK